MPYHKNKVTILFRITIKYRFIKSDIEEVSKKIRESNLSYENLEIKNRKLILKLDEISEKVLTVVSLII